MLTSALTLSGVLSRLVVIEPGRQSFQTELFGFRRCGGAGPITPETITVNATTEAGVNVVQQVRVDLSEARAPGTFGKATIVVDLDVPADAKLVTFEFVVEPLIGVIRRTAVVGRLNEVSLSAHSAFGCDVVVPWTPQRSICVRPNQPLVLEPDGGFSALGRSDALAVTPAGLWSVSSDGVSFFPSDGGSLSWWEQHSRPRAIATSGDRVFIGTEVGVAELVRNQRPQYGAIDRFPPTALRVEEPDLLIARQERIDRVPLASFPLTAQGPQLPEIPPVTHVGAVNFNAVAGLWRVEGRRIEFTTDAGVLALEVPHLLTEVASNSPALTDETPLIALGFAADDRPVWLQPLEDLDAGTLSARYLVAPRGQRLSRANSQHIFASGVDGGTWAPRR
ncbi:MAG: hypothetical protein JNM69_34775 [Archangium sp.]|nr:hypothetical protein [Archangium sp.]